MSRNIRKFTAKIPKNFMLFGTKVSVVWDNKYCNDKSIYGESDYSQSKITLSHTHGVNNLSEGKIIDTYYHEKVHMILDTMHEKELSMNERFVDQFAKLLRQADETSKF